MGFGIAGVSNKADMRWLHLHLARKLLPSLEEGRVSVGVGVGVGYGGRAQSVQTSAFKSAGRSILGKGNFEIRALGSILLFFLIKSNDLSDEKVVLLCCCNLTSTHSSTGFHI